MTKNTITRVRKLLKKLNKEEVESLRVYLSAFQRSYGNYEPKSLQLLELLLEEEDVISDAEIKNRISPGASQNTFGKLLARLKEKIYECLSLDINIFRNGAYSKYYAAKLNLRKKLSQAEIFLVRGMGEEAIYLFDEISDKAKKYEIYDTLAEALFIRQTSVGARYGAKEYHQLRHEHAFYSRCQEALRKALHWYYHFSLPEDFHIQKESREEQLKKAIAELATEAEYTKSGYVYYYLYLLKINYYEQTGDYYTVQKTCMELLGLAQKHKQLFVNKVLGTIYMNLAHNAVCLHTFSPALEYALEAKQYFKVNSFNYLYALEYEFYAHFYAGSINEAESILKDLIARTEKEETPFRHNKRLYLYACVLFSRQHYKEAHEFLQQCKEINQDKEGWNIGVRILLIMSHIARKLFDVAEAQIETLREHIRETNKHKQVRQRDITILKILVHLDKTAYDFRKTLNDKPYYFDLLASDEKEYKWQVPGAELVRFDNWFKTMANQKQPLEKESQTRELDYSTMVVAEVL